MYCTKCKFLEEHQEIDSTFSKPLTQFFCALDPCKDGWEPITPMLTREEAEEAVKDAVCHHDPQKVLVAVKDELARCARMLPLVEDALARAKASSR
jgi:hypothetical protein